MHIVLRAAGVDGSDRVRDMGTDAKREGRQSTRKPGQCMTLAVTRTLELSVNLRSSKGAKRKGRVRVGKENAEHQ